MSKRYPSSLESPYYDKTNPYGPWKTTPRSRWPDELARAGHIEGLSSAKNLKQWSDRASKNSGPRQMPGLGGRRDASTLPAVKPPFRESD
jgi:hypothetical protein